MDDPPPSDPDIPKSDIGKKLKKNLNKCCNIQIPIGPFNIFGRQIDQFYLIKLNPIVTIASALIIWFFVGVCIALPLDTNKHLGQAQRWVTEVWTWLYIGTQDIWFVFIIVIFFSKYGKVKLGKDDEEPEYSNTTYFTMLFAAGVGVGLFYFGVAEAIFHYTGQNRYKGRHNDNARAQDAIFVVFFHWGIHGWIVYVLVGMLLGVIAYRNDLPMTMRSCFHPLLGDKVFGRLGDLIDILSVICTMFGVCTSLGLGVIQLNAGLHRVNSDIPTDFTTQVAIIWIITAIATVSVVSGVGVGIRRLSEICFGVGCFILFYVFFYDNTWYLLNLLTQSIGYYFQYLLQIGFQTDAFEQLGNAPDHDENKDWMNDWTMFYWGWWIAWSPFVGMFIAKISKGRTIREFITYTLTVPVLYIFFWFTVFGGSALRMERDAELAGIECSSPMGGTNSTEPLGRLWRLSCRGTNDMWFDLIGSYGGVYMGKFMQIISLAAIVLYFVTSSDSGSLVIDCLSANGDPEPPTLQRIFWSFTEGATATALLSAGATATDEMSKVASLKALQSVSIIAGLFYTIILNFMCVALWRSLQIACGDLSPNYSKWRLGLFDPFYSRNIKSWAKMALAVVAPWWFVSGAAAKIYDGSRFCYAILLGIPFNVWLILTILQPTETGLAYVGWAILMFYFAIASGIRASIREHDGILGNLGEDFFSVMLMYPNAAVQMDYQMENESSNLDASIYDKSRNLEMPMNDSQPSMGAPINDKGSYNDGFVIEPPVYRIPPPQITTNASNVTFARFPSQS